MKRWEQVLSFYITMYENMPIQIYRKFHLQKLKFFYRKLIFFIFLLKTKIVGTR